MRLIDAVGRTPLLELPRIASSVPGLRLLAKAEYRNPGGSVKDRPARAMILDGIARGLLSPGKTILEATSGNTGIADAMIGRALGFRVTLCVPGNVSAERRAILAAYGAEILLTDPLEGTDGAIRKARAARGGTAGPLLLSGPVLEPGELAGALRDDGPGDLGRDRRTADAFRRGPRHLGNLRRRDAISPQEGSFHPLRLGRAGRAAARPGRNEAHGVRDGARRSTTRRSPTRGAKSRPTTPTRCAAASAREEGVFVGPSSGANVAAALAVARELDGAPATIVTILCDGGDRYLSADFWRQP